MKKTISVFLVLVLSVTIFLFLLFIYSKIDQEVQTGYRYSYTKYIENIDTPAKKWLNGHLGIFFRFKYFGNVLWFAIPLIIYFISTIRTKKRWPLALAFVYIVSALLLGIRGFSWWRYQFTLYPITVAIVMLLGWEFIRDKGFILKTSSFFLVLCLVLFNVYHYSDSYKSLWTFKASMINKKYPTQVLNYINDIEYDNPQLKFLVCCNSHIFFYYTNKSAIPFYSPEYRRVLSRLDRKSLYQFLKNKLNVSYVMSDWQFEQENRHLSIAEIMDLDCKKIFSDTDRGYHLSLLRNKLLEEELKSNSYYEYKIWDSTSLQPETSSLQPKVQGIKGKFDFKYKKIEGRIVLTVSSMEGGKQEERLVQFGYTLNNEIIEANSLKSKFVYFLVEAKIPENIINKENYIFIQDFDGKWQRTRTNFVSPKWRNYLVYKKIRPHSSEVGIGFTFKPQSNKDILQIRDIKIYFLNQEL